MAEKDLGIKKETAGALAYVLGPVTGVFFLVTSKDPFVRFHAMQSIVVFVALFALQIVLGLTIILGLLIPFINILGFVLWLLCIYKAWQGDEWKIPFIGNLAVKLVKKA